MLSYGMPRALHCDHSSWCLLYSFYNTQLARMIKWWHSRCKLLVPDAVPVHAATVERNGRVIVPAAAAAAAAPGDTSSKALQACTLLMIVRDQFATQQKRKHSACSLIQYPAMLLYVQQYGVASFSLLLHAATCCSLISSSPLTRQTACAVSAGAAPHR
jgi:hypothetical protein